MAAEPLPLIPPGTSTSPGTGRRRARPKAKQDGRFGSLHRTTMADRFQPRAPGEGKGRKHPRLAIAANGETLMTWTEGTGWARGGSLAWQVFDARGTPVGGKHLESGLPAWSFGTAVPTRTGFLIVY